MVTKPSSSSRAADPMDKHIGSRIRMQRIIRGKSQQALAQFIGLTFQQVQKYEKGTNRCPPSRLQKIGEFLQVPASFFFEGYDTEEHETPAMPQYLVEFMGMAEGRRVVEAFGSMTDRALRSATALLVVKLAAMKSQKKKKK